jgi:hypothetical protein
MPYMKIYIYIHILRLHFLKRVRWACHLNLLKRVRWACHLHLVEKVRWGCHLHLGERWACHPHLIKRVRWVCHLQLLKGVRWGCHIHLLKGVRWACLLHLVKKVRWGCHLHLLRSHGCATPTVVRNSYFALQSRGMLYPSYFKGWEVDMPYTHTYMTIYIYIAFSSIFAPSSQESEMGLSPAPS